MSERMPLDDRAQYFDAQKAIEASTANREQTPIDADTIEGDILKHLRGNFFPETEGYRESSVQRSMEQHKKYAEIDAANLHPTWGKEDMPAPEEGSLEYQRERNRKRWAETDALQERSRMYSEAIRRDRRLENSVYHGTEPGYKAVGRL